jgi:hypothetical protein
MSPLADACDDLARWLPRAAALTATPDTAARTRASGKPGSRPPWNPQAAMALLDALAAIADTEALLRLIVTGRSGRRRPPSATGAALDAIASLGHGVAQGQSRDAARELCRHVQAIRTLPAVDEAEKWERLRVNAEGHRPFCPFCATPNLRVAVRAGLVACAAVGCTDLDGNRPVATMMLGAVSGTPMVVGPDGTVWAVAP